MSQVIHVRWQDGDGQIVEILIAPTNGDLLTDRNQLYRHTSIAIKNVCALTMVFPFHLETQVCM